MTSNTTPQSPPSGLRLSPRTLGLLAVLMFAMTIPMTRLANGHGLDPQLPPLFVALGRGVLAALVAGFYLWWVKAPFPPREVRPWLAGVVLGGVLAFPACMGWAVKLLPAWHASVVTGVLPLLTAALAAWWLGHRPGLGFWLAGLVGVGLVLCFALLGASAQPVSAPGFVPDAVLLLGMLGASVAYVSGAKAAQSLPSAQVMSWALVLALPVTLPGALMAWSATPGLQASHMALSTWLAFVYVAVCSSWLGFFAWYAALARDAMRVSQLQLLQPFAAMGLSAVLLGEQVSPWAPVFACGVALAVWVGQKHIRPAPAVSTLTAHHVSPASAMSLPSHRPA
jgi:drug/metabolite transporter (DMT)-like permease